MTQHGVTGCVQTSSYSTSGAPAPLAAPMNKSGFPATLRAARAQCRMHMHIHMHIIHSHSHSHTVTGILLELETAASMVDPATWRRPWT